VQQDVALVGAGGDVQEAQLVGPFRRYLPRGRNMLLRWGLRLLFVLLIALQWIPVAGGLVIPVMALLSYTVYRNAFAAQYAGFGKPG